MALKGDKQLKQERGYRGKSYVRPDGSEVLFGVDWQVRKRELWRRCGGLCEMGAILKKPHVAGCFGGGDEPHHLVPRREGRDDRLTNLAALSHACHASLDSRKPRFGGKTKPVQKRRHREEAKS